MLVAELKHKVGQLLAERSRLTRQRSRLCHRREILTARGPARATPTGGGSGRRRGACGRGGNERGGASECAADEGIEDDECFIQVPDYDQVHFRRL